MGLQAKEKGQPGIMIMHRDAPYYEHAIVVFHISGKATITLDYTKTKHDPQSIRRAEVHLKGREMYVLHDRARYDT